MGLGRNVQQAAFVSDDEMIRIVAHWKQPASLEVVEQPTEPERTEASHSSQVDANTQLLNQAISEVRKARVASVVMLHRTFQYDGPTAANLMDILEEQGVIAPSMGSWSKPRAVLDFGDDTPSRSLGN